MQKEAIVFNCAHFIDYFANASSFHDAREGCLRCANNNIASLSIFPTDLCLLKPWICCANYPKSHKQNVLHSHNFLRIWVALFKYCISTLHISCERKVERAMRRLIQGKAYIHFCC